MLRALAAAACILLSFPAASRGLPRVLYFNDDDPRTPASLEKLKRAIAASKWHAHRPVEVELVRVRFDDPALAVRIREAIDRAGPVAALVAPNGVTALAAKQATTAVPIVFGMHQDPVALGAVRSLQSSGNNLTGFTFHVPIQGKRLEILREVRPRLRRLGVVHDRWWDPDPLSRELEREARRFGLEVEYFEAQTAAELQALLRSRPHAHIEAWFVYSGPAYREPAATVAAINATCKPALYDQSALAAHGAMITFQPSVPDPYGQWAKLLGLVIAGVPPSRIPVERPRDFELKINLAPATKCGISIPAPMLRRANEVLQPVAR